MRAAPRHRSSAQLDAIVLTHLARANGPAGAYDIVHRAGLDGEPIVPTQVYRTLARLIAQDRVIRVETLSAYVLRRTGMDACMICDRCHAVQLLPAPEVVSELQRCAVASGYSFGRAIIEAQGRCPDCSTTLAGDASRAAEAVQ